MKKFDFENYSQWCKKNGFEVDNPDAMVNYKVHMEKSAQEGEKACKIAKQKEVFDTIAKYLGVKTKYDSKHFDGVQQALEGICFAMEMCNLMDNTNKSLDKVLDTYVCKNKGEKAND